MIQRRGCLMDSHEATPTLSICLFTKGAASK